MTTELDNLQNAADGENKPNLNPEENTPETNQIESAEQSAENESVEETVTSEASTENEETQAAENEETAQDLGEEQALPAETEEENEVVEAKEEAADFNQDADEPQEEEEEEVIPFKNYEDLPLPVLIGEAKALLKDHPARTLREHFSQIREAVKKILEEDEAAKKEAFIEEGGEEAAFQYDNPARREFNSVYSDYRNQLDLYYKEQEKQQQENLKIRLQIIEDLKALYQDSNEETSNVFTKFRKIKTLWHNAGPVPRVQAGNVFRTYFHHLDNFYKYLDMNKELREMDYAHNLEVRESIIKRAEQLLNEENVQKALNELQYLHRLWKEEAVPVVEEMREPTWQRFKDLTLKIHERKLELSEKIKEEQEENLKKKREILDQIKQLFVDSEKKSHGEWQNGIKKLNKLREDFISTGRVPKEFNQKLWDEFKAVTRDFNHKKNEFYKTLKNEQQQNLDKKYELLKIAKEHADSIDWDKSVQVIKKIQADWKKIGHVPRKESDKIWKEFKDACNLFFDNFKARGSRTSPEFAENLEKKENLLEEVKSFKSGEDQQANLDKINEFNMRWAEIGKVPAAKMSINTDFSKAINELVKSMGLSNDEIQDFKMSALMDRIKSGQDGQMLDDEIRRTRKLMEELEKEINQLENNIGFFSDENSPLLKNFHKQIEEKKAKLAESALKLKKLHRIDFNEETGAPKDEAGSAETDTAAES